MAQVWLAFALALGTTMVGVFYLPVEIWVKAFLGMGLLFTVGSTVNLAKTTRDIFEAEKLASRVDEARMERLLVEHDPLK